MTSFDPQTPVQLQAASARLPMFGQSDENVSAVAAGLANTDHITSRPLLASHLDLQALRSEMLHCSGMLQVRVEETCLEAVAAEAPLPEPSLRHPKGLRPLTAPAA